MTKSINNRQPIESRNKASLDARDSDAALPADAIKKLAGL
jgi:hypothetical protein